MVKFGLFAAAFAVGTMMTGGGALAQGDPEEGKKVFRKCAVCHTTEEGKHKIGPSLHGVFGREAGTVEGFRQYSPAMKKSKVTWNEENLDKYLENPRKFIKGGRMIFPGLKSKEERDNVIAYLKTLK